MRFCKNEVFLAIHNLTKYKSYRLRSIKKAIPKNFAIVAGKQLCWGLFLINFIQKTLQRRCFHLKIAKLFRTPIFKNICERPLLEVIRGIRDPQQISEMF